MAFRPKLIISYAVVITVTLALAVGLFAIIFRQIQDDSTNKAIERLRSVTNNLSEYIAQPIDGELSLSQYQALLVRFSQLLDVRILLVDDAGRVLCDTVVTPPASMLNQLMPGYKLVPDDGRPHDGTFKLKDVPYFYYGRSGPNFRGTSAQSQPARVDFRFGPTANLAIVKTDLLLTVPQESLYNSWDTFIKGMAVAVVVALLVSTALALLIARNVTRPLVKMTRASTAIAQGNYNAQLPVTGNDNDEIGRLSHSFNHMAREVARSHQTTRDFVANVSHELKTPLTSIQGYSQAIIEGVADDRDSLEHSAAVIYNEAARMRRLVDELLDLSRIESGQAALYRQELDLSQLVKRVLMRLGPLASDKNLAFQHRLNEGRGPMVLGDPDRLEQVFTNILDNALKYSRENSMIWLEMNPGPAGWVGVAIGNIGPLIPPEQLDRIFERFYKLDPSRKRKGESTGLGLAITKELVEAHQGMISVTSQPLPPGQGLPGEGFTIFTINLPTVTPVPMLKSPPINLKR